MAADQSRACPEGQSKNMGLWPEDSGFQQDRVCCDTFCSKEDESREAERWEACRGESVTPRERREKGPGKSKRNRGRSRVQGVLRGRLVSGLPWLAAGSSPCPLCQPAPSPLQGSPQPWLLVSALLSWSLLLPPLLVLKEAGTFPAWLWAASGPGMHSPSPCHLLWSLLPGNPRRSWIGSSHSVSLSLTWVFCQGLPALSFLLGALIFLLKNKKQKTFNDFREKGKGRERQVHR